MNRPISNYLLYSSVEDTQIDSDDVFDFKDFHASFVLYECCELFMSLHIRDRESFLLYLKDEYSGIDDCYSIIFDCIFNVFLQVSSSLSTSLSSTSLYSMSLSSILDSSLEECKRQYPNIEEEDIDMMLQSILCYAKDCLSDAVVNL